jgi:hypothetical protein
MSYTNQEVLRTQPWLNQSHTDRAKSHITSARRIRRAKPPSPPPLPRAAASKPHPRAPLGVAAGLRESRESGEKKKTAHTGAARHPPTRALASPAPPKLAQASPSTRVPPRVRVWGQELWTDEWFLLGKEDRKWVKENKEGTSVFSSTFLICFILKNLKSR